MIAPDKIYINNDEWHYYPVGEECEEYIRKDALLEWLEYEKEWFEGTDIEPHYQKVIDKLNSM